MKWTSLLAGGLAALTTVLATGADVVAAKSTWLQTASVQESRQRSVAELRDGNGLRGYAVLNDVDGLTAMLDRGERTRMIVDLGEITLVVAERQPGFDANTVDLPGRGGRSVCRRRKHGELDR